MKSRTSSTGVMESTQQPVQMGGSVNPNWWRPSTPVTTITSYQQQHQQHYPPYNFLLHPPNTNNFLPFFSAPNNSIIHSPYSPQPTSSSNSSSWHEHENHHPQLLTDGQQQHPSDTWTQLLMNGMGQDEGEKQSAGTEPLTQNFQKTLDKLELQNHWEQNPELIMLQQQQQHDDHLHDLNYDSNNSLMDIKQEHHSSVLSCSSHEMFGHGNEGFLAAKMITAAWPSSIVMPKSSSPKSCVTSFLNSTNTMLDFSSDNYKGDEIRQPAPDLQSESNSSATGGASKKARVQPSPPQSSNNTIKVRKEKLGDRITALHQLVSPFGKTDTASVLLETMGYIRFLQSQIEALSLLYLGGTGSASTRQQQLHMHAQGESICIFPEDPGQLLNDNCIKRKASSDLQQQPSENVSKKDLRSRGLCLVPVSCTLQVGSDNGADYWAPPPAFGGGFR